MLLNTTAYHPPTNGKMKMYKRMILARMRHYVKELQTDRDDYVQPLTNGCHSQVRKRMGTAPFMLILRCEPLGPMEVIPSTTVRAGRHGTLTLWQLMDKVLEKLTLVTAKADGKTQRARASWTQ